jgi:hypothetical protein
MNSHASGSLKNILAGSHCGPQKPLLYTDSEEEKEEEEEEGGEENRRRLAVSKLLALNKVSRGSYVFWG